MALKTRNSISVLVAADRPEVQDYVRSSLESDLNLSISAVAATSKEEEKLVCQSTPAVQIVDGRLPGLGDLSTLIAENSSVRVLVIVQRIRTAEIIGAVRIGAHGILRDSDTPNVLRDTVRKLAADELCFDSESIRIMLETLRRPQSSDPEPRQLGGYALTRRELQIIAKVTSGCTNRRVGQEFAISERTVKHHLTNIYNKIGVTNRLSLAMFALDHQIMDKI